MHAHGATPVMKCKEKVGSSMFGSDKRPARARAVMALLLVTVLATFGLSASALAVENEFSIFADCPLTTASACVHADTESGEVVIGSKAVPIEKTITLQGGLNETEAGELVFVAAKDGNTLSKAPQKVPGGLAGLVKCNEIKGSGLLEKAERASCEVIFENGVT